MTGHALSEVNNLAQLLQTTNCLAEAEPLMRRAVASLGGEHPNTITFRQNLDLLLQKLDSDVDF